MCDWGRSLRIKIRHVADDTGHMRENGRSAYRSPVLQAAQFTKLPCVGWHLYLLTNDHIVENDIFCIAQT